jgi:hypothetical protein
VLEATNTHRTSKNRFTISSVNFVATITSETVHLHLKAEHQAQLVQLPIWSFASVVLVFVVGIELDVFAYRKKAPNVDRGVTPCLCRDGPEN